LLVVLAALTCTALSGADELPKGDWVAAGYPAQARTVLRTHLRKSIERGEIPGGSLLLMHGDKVIFDEGFGFAHIGKKQAFEIDVPVRVASISKPIIATLIVKLDANGVLDLDRPIDKYLPQLRKLRLTSGNAPKRMPTLRECLKHTAGFVSDYEDGGRPWLRLSRKGLTLAEVVEREIKLPMPRQPGRGFAYSGAGYDIAGRVVEIVTKRPLNDVLREELCKPLGMAHTTYYPSKAQRGRMPNFYWMWRSDATLHRRRDRPAIPDGEYISVGGGVVSTARDLARFLLLHRHEGKIGKNQLVPRESMLAMVKRSRPGSYYGLGFSLGPDNGEGHGAWLSHTGSSGTYFWLDRTTGTLGVMLTQHSTSRGRPIKGIPPKIPEKAPSWQKVTKMTYIDPVLGWPEAANKAR